MKSVLDGLLYALCIACMVLLTFRYRAVAGTRLRYTLSSLLQLVELVTALCAALNAVHSAMHQQWSSAFALTLVSAVIFEMWHDECNIDEDNFWRAPHKKIKQKLKSMASKTSSVPLLN
jgi:hypothetical protein